jgi:hypothetical protein
MRWSIRGGYRGEEKEVNPVGRPTTGWPIPPCEAELDIVDYLEIVMAEYQHVEEHLESRRATGMIIENGTVKKKLFGRDGKCKM